MKIKKGEEPLLQLKTLFAYSIINPDSYKEEYDEVQGLVNEYNEMIKRRHAVKTNPKPTK